MHEGRCTRHQTIPILLLVAVLGLGMVHTVEAAITDYLGQPIAQVRVQQEGVEIRDRLTLELIQTRIGQPLEMMQVRETIGHLFSLGRYEDV